MPARPRSNPREPASAARETRATGAPKIQRWIDLLATLLGHKYPRTFEEIARDVPAYANPAQKAGARARMFERDKDELKAFGVPITAVVREGDLHAYSLAPADFYLPYLVATASAGSARPRRVDEYGYRALATLSFEPEELALVAEAATRVRSLGDPVLAADAATAMRKLAFDLPMDASLPTNVARLAPARDTVDVGVYEGLGDALLRRKRVSFDYHAMDKDSSSERTVEPYGLFFLSSHWYLAAHDTGRSAVRTFRLSRIAKVRVNAMRLQTPDYEVPVDFSLRDHARSKPAWELGDGEALTVVVAFARASGAARAAEQLGEAVEGEAGQRRFQVRRTDAFCRWLLSFGGDARAVSPPSVVGELATVAASTLALYEGDAQ